MTWLVSTTRKKKCTTFWLDDDADESVKVTATGELWTDKQSDQRVVALHQQDRVKQRRRRVERMRRGDLEQDDIEPTHAAHP